MAERTISQAIKKAETDLRSRFPILNYQDALGGGVFLGSLIGIFNCWAYYWYHSDCCPTCAVLILLVALFTSFLHELEHDLIHNLYFKKSSWVQDVMFFSIWLAKLHGNPWFRRDLHLRHHIISGQRDDAEERLIGLGLPPFLERMAVTMHPFGSLIITPAVGRDAKWLDVQKLNLTSMPVAFLFFGLNKAWMVYVLTMCLVGYENYHLYLPARLWGFIRASAVLICLPNILRQFCLVMMSNCSHYYGDIPEKSVFYQNQILDHPIVYPFQLLCMNFGECVVVASKTILVYIHFIILLTALALLWCNCAGATHIVHHYVPGQPFYLREMVYRVVKPLMIEKGVRLNDFGVVSRGNLYYDDSVRLPDGSIVPGADKKVSANNSHVHSMALWAAACSTVGLAGYLLWDVWSTAALGRRILRKYVRRMKGE
jgi:fatty acid desaturase